MRKRILLFIVAVCLLLFPITAFSEQAVDWAERITVKIESSPLSNIAFEYNSADNRLTYYLSDEPAWETDAGPDNRQFVRIRTSVKRPSEAITHFRLNENNEVLGVNENGFAPAFNIPFDKPTTGFRQRDNICTFHWRTSVSGSDISVETLKISIVPTYLSVNVPTSRITVQQSLNASKRDGSASYPEDALGSAASVSTSVSVPNGATQYQLNGGEKQSVNTNNILSISTDTPSHGGASNTDYTIQWYKSINESSTLIATEKLTVRFTPTPAFTPFDASAVTFADLDGIDDIVIPQDAQGKISAVIPIHDRMTGSQWETALMNYAGDTYVSIPITFTLPEDATDATVCGTSIDTTDTQALQTLQSLQYVGVNQDRKVLQNVELAGVAYDGTTAIIAPVTWRGHSYLLKWADANGTEHFHRINYTLTHESLAAHKVFAVCPSPSRIIPADCETSSYEDGVVTYTCSAEQVQAQARLQTYVVRPSEDAASVIIKPAFGNPSTQQVVDGKVYLSTGVMARIVSGTSYLSWKDASGNVLKNEILTIVSVPSGNTWMEQYWAPAAPERVGVEANAASVLQHMTYHNGCWTFSVKEDKPLDLPLLCSGERFFRITAPENAVYFKAASWHSPLHGSEFSTGTQNELNDSNNPLVRIDSQQNNMFYSGEPNKLKFSWGNIFTRAELSGTGMTIYTVNKTMAGYGDIALFQWYDSNQCPISCGEKNGEYVYLKKAAYVKETSTNVQSLEPDAPVTDPIAVSNTVGAKLKTELPLQENGNSNAKQVYMNLTYLDANGNEIVPSADVEVYIAYPEGVTYETAAGYTFTMRHYTDENHTAYELVTLEPTPYGLKFVTRSFSPFLLSVVDNTSCSSGSGNGYIAPTATTLQTPSGNIQLKGAGVAANDVLIADSLTSGSDYQFMLQAAGSQEVIGIYNISLQSGKPFGSPMELSFTVSGAYAGQPFTLAHKLADGTIEYFYATADASGNVTFGPVYQLSPFMLVKGTLMPVTVPETTITTTPKTGDGTVTWLGIGAMVLALSIGIGAAIRRKRTQVDM